MNLLKNIISVVVIVDCIWTIYYISRNIVTERNAILIFNEDSDESSTEPKNDILPKAEYSFVILIPSLPDDIIRRHHYRSKFLNISAWKSKEFEGISKEWFSFKVMFIIGKEENKTTPSPAGLTNEMADYDDILVEETLIESRATLRYKILWGMNKSVQEFEYRYLIKIDQDTLIDLPRLLKGLSHLSRKYVYTGLCKLRLYGTAKYQLPQYKDLVYCQGGAYILSRDMIEILTEIDSKSPDYFIEPEDGYVGWLVKEAKSKFNITTSMPQHSEKILKDRFAKNKKKIVLNHFWFYHIRREKGQISMTVVDTILDTAFNCINNSEENCSILDSDI